VRPALLLCALLACAHAPAGGPTTLRRETVREDRAELALELSDAPRGPRKVELVLRMRVAGLVETSKLVAEVYIRGFNVEAGNTRWEGFVPPRDPQTYRVTLSIPDDAREATAKIGLSRSHDSLPLLREELAFTVDDRGAVTARPAGE
jgi:hypothetical protein